MSKLNAVSDRIIGAAIAVHRELGPGLLERAYLACLAEELREQGLAFEQQVRLPVVYKRVRLDVGYRVDMMVEGLVVVELKAVAKLEPVHTAQVLTYLRLTGRELGLLINFNNPTLIAGVRRIVWGRGVASRHPLPAGRPEHRGPLGRDPLNRDPPDRDPPDRELLDRTD